nr:large subunit GTPase 1 [Cryptococcus depauperatus CBS 7855]
MVCTISQIKRESYFDNLKPPRTKVQRSGLGKALINRKAKEAVAPQESQLYTLDDNNPLASVTHERDLDEFLSNAALADQDFTTERSKMRIISAPGMVPSNVNPFLLSEEQEQEVIKKKADYSGGLTVPRRPPWSRSTTRLELEKQERESFLDWRRDIAKLAETSNLLLTPFERNIQLWRQLWRVLERSQLIVQIVDARNPLGFRCQDLENYVREIGSDENDSEITVTGKGKRKNLLLINKADLLTYDQRCVWADYFETQGISYAFFSATNAAALQGQSETQQLRTAGALAPHYEEEDDSAKSSEDGDIHDEEDIDERLDVGIKNTYIDEEGWSTEDEDNKDNKEAKSEVDTKLEAGEKLPLEQVAQNVSAKNARLIEQEDIRAQVLSVTELEDLFINSAPDLKNFSTPQFPNPKLTVGLVGYPNVGKSSTINSLLGAKKVSVSSTPGKTKHFQTLILSDVITLCDCPGLVFPQFADTQADMVVDGILPIDQMKEYSAPVDLLCARIPREILEGTYGIRIDVKDEDEGGTGRVGWEEFLSAYAIARGMTRSSFGMPDTSRAARHVLKDYVNAKLLYAHPPPGITPDEFMTVSRSQTLKRLEEAFENGRKRAPTTHVSKNADTYVAPVKDIPLTDGEVIEATKKQRQSTSHQVKSTAASAPSRSGKEKAAALDNVYFNDIGPQPRLVVKGRNQTGDVQEGGQGFARPTKYPHQRILGPDGMPILGGNGRDLDVGNGKKHFKRKEGKKRSGKGYD